jgi:hypothetical protein
MIGAIDKGAILGVYQKSGDTVGRSVSSVLIPATCFLRRVGGVKLAGVFRIWN